MINLVFSAQRKIVRFCIHGRKVIYYDDNWNEGLQVYPEDRMLSKRLIISRKPSLSAMGLLIKDANMGKNLEQYNGAKNEEELAEVIRKDCLLKGLVEVK